ncbi:MAG: branched-chain amino acid ABC transporter permease [Acidimicrobiales bacterium]
MTLFLVGVVTGLGLGGIYAIVALSYTIIVAASGVFNFAIGSIVMGGGLTAYGLSVVLHLPLLGVVGVVAVGGAIVGIATYVGSVAPVTRRLGVRGMTETTLVTTLGLGLAFNQIMTIAFGINTYPDPGYVSQQAFIVAGAPIQPAYILIVCAAVLIAVVFEGFLRKTRMGLLLRASVEDPEGALLAGISVRKVTLRAFAAGGLLAAIAGLLVVPLTDASSNIATQVGLWSFVGMGIGGFGSFSGALVGGLIAGLITGIGQVYVNPSLVNLIVYVVLVAVLLIRPTGLFGARGGFGTAKLREI